MPAAGQGVDRPAPIRPDATELFSRYHPYAAEVARHIAHGAAPADQQEAAAEAVEDYISTAPLTIVDEEARRRIRTLVSSKLEHRRSEERRRRKMTDDLALAHTGPDRSDQSDQLVVSLLHEISGALTPTDVELFTSDRYASAPASVTARLNPSAWSSARARATARALRRLDRLVSTPGDDPCHRFDQAIKGVALGDASVTERQELEHHLKQVGCPECDERLSLCLRVVATLPGAAHRSWRAGLLAPLGLMLRRLRRIRGGRGHVLGARRVPWLPNSLLAAGSVIVVAGTVPVLAFAISGSHSKAARPGPARATGPEVTDGNSGPLGPGPTTTVAAGPSPTLSRGADLPAAATWDPGSPSQTGPVPPTAAPPTSPVPPPSAPVGSVPSPTPPPSTVPTTSPSPGTGPPAAAPPPPVTSPPPPATTPGPTTLPPTSPVYAMTNTATVGTPSAGTFSIAIVSIVTENGQPTGGLQVTVASASCLDSSSDATDQVGTARNTLLCAVPSPANLPIVLDVSVGTLTETVTVALA